MHRSRVGPSSLTCVAIEGWVFSNHGVILASPSLSGGGTEWLPRNWRGPAQYLTSVALGWVRQLGCPRRSTIAPCRSALSNAVIQLKPWACRNAVLNFKSLYPLIFCTKIHTCGASRAHYPGEITIHCSFRHQIEAINWNPHIA